MENEIKPLEDVEYFLKKVKLLAFDKETTMINNAYWANGRVNKTQAYMAETGITGEVIRDIVGNLKVQNYSSTKEDRNLKFPDEEVWEFGITQNLIDQEEDLYIKLKIRKIEDEYLLIMSFHPERPTCPDDKLMFPYRDNEE